MARVLALSGLFLIQAICASRELRIALYVGQGVGHGDPDAYWRVLPQAAAPLGNFSITNLTAEDVREKLTTDLFDVIFFPGGSGSGQARGLQKKGMAAVRAFVTAGGGYIGTCGGAYLGLKHIMFYGRGSRGRGIPTKSPWARGKGNVQIDFTGEGLSKLALDRQRFDGNVTIHYAQGPIISARSLPKEVTILSWFRTEIHSRYTRETMGQMINTPAMTSIEYGAGRVVLNSPHPEFAPHLPSIYEGELTWVLRRGSASPPLFLYM